MPGRGRCDTWWAAAPWLISPPPWLSHVPEHSPLLCLLHRCLVPGPPRLPGVPAQMSYDAPPRLLRVRQRCLPGGVCGIT